MKDYKSTQPRFQALLQEIKNIHEEVDQSREQACSPMMEQPIPKYQETTPSHSFLKATMLTQKLSESIIRTDEKVAHKRIEDQIQTFSLEEINELREINKKLFEDNQTLFRECVRLRKVNPSKPSALYPQTNEKLRLLELENIHNMNEINKLKTQNLHLKAQLYNYNSTNKLQHLPEIIQGQFTVLHSRESKMQKIIIERVQRLDQLKSLNQITIFRVLKNKSYWSTHKLKKGKQYIIFLGEGNKVLQQRGQNIQVYYQNDINSFLLQYIPHFRTMNSSQSPNRFDSFLFLLKTGILGAGRAFISLPLQHPFDTIKTNMQSLQLSAKQTVSYIQEVKGWKGFYNGFSLNLIRVSCKQLYRWPLWIGLSSFYDGLLGKVNELYKQSIISFSISFAELIIICPFERLKIWLMTTQTQQQTKLKNYFKLHSTISDLYTGFTPLLVRQTLSWTSFLASSESIKNRFKQYKCSDTLTPAQLLLISLPVSLINTFFIMPADCIKTFYQKYKSSNKGESFWKISKQGLRQYGLTGLYKGWNIRLIQYTINSMFTLVLFQELKRQYEKMKN